MNENAIRRLEAAIEAYDALIYAVTQNYLDGGIEEEEWLGLTTKWANRRRRAKKMLEELRKESPS